MNIDTDTNNVAKEFVNHLVQFSPTGAYCFFFAVLLGVMGKSVVEFTRNWRSWRVKLHVLEHCKARLEVEKLRYEILLLQYNLAEKEGVDGKVQQILPRDPAEDILEAYEPADEGGETFNINTMKDFVARLTSSQAFRLNFGSGEFRPWRWFKFLHGLSPWLSLVVLVVMGAIACIWLLFGLLLLVGAVGSTSTDPTPLYVKHGSWVLAFPSGILLLSAFLGWKVKYHLRLFRSGSATGKEPVARSSAPPPLPEPHPPTPHDGD